jgi:predicted Zn-dependent protease with MMP-like domain
LTRDEFEQIAQEEFDALPEPFRSRVENVHVVVEETDSREPRKKARVRPGGFLLGLYEGVPLVHRGTGYGAYPVLPDRITLFQKNIESVAASVEEIRVKIREVLIHEIAHHFGMSEREIRNAGY